MKKITGILILAILLAMAFTACGTKRINTDIDGQPAKVDEFYESTRLIMLKNERQIYKHLPDEDSRKVFIEDFWKKRDPNPETDENENRLTFERRLEYVERFFREHVGGGRGWDSDRGKVFLLLGGPDTRTTQRMAVPGRMGRRIDALTELWVYDHYRLILRFVDEEGFGVYRLRRWPTDLLTAFERAKFEVYQPEKLTDPFTFKAKFKDNSIGIEIPAKKVDFEDHNGGMAAHFKIKVYVYHNYKKIDSLEETRDITGEKEDLLGMKNFALALPYTLPGKGKYFFDIIVEDVSSTARYRNMVSYKY
jgi:GWxTD domain-containing protein